MFITVINHASVVYSALGELAAALLEDQASLAA